MPNAALESIFSVSTALAFTLWQHLGAMEWLSASADWLAERPQVFAEADGKGGFALSGVLPWVTGHGIFPRLIDAAARTSTIDVLVMDSSAQ